MTPPPDHEKDSDYRFFDAASKAIFDERKKLNEEENDIPPMLSQEKALEILNTAIAAYPYKSDYIDWGATILAKTQGLTYNPATRTFVLFIPPIDSS